MNVLYSVDYTSAGPFIETYDILGVVVADRQEVAIPFAYHKVYLKSFCRD